MVEEVAIPYAGVLYRDGDIYVHILYGSYPPLDESVTVSWSRCEAHLQTGENGRWCLLLKVGADSWYYEFDKLEEAFRPFAEFVAGSPRSLANQTLEEGEESCKEISKSTD